MKIIIHEKEGNKIAEIVSDGIIVNTTEDALDLMVHREVRPARKIILHKENIIPDFFDLRTGIAGEILQKFVNYRVELAIVGDFSKITSENFKAFMRESNRGREIFFLETVEQAKEKLGVV
ncbi:MAG: DUF4180 domain-containing protein [Candidatus Paceibacterota bacterium]|jgi:hypothetical protein